jgi:hypothetical protein
MKGFKKVMSKYEIEKELKSKYDMIPTIFTAMDIHQLSQELEVLLL